MKPGNLLEVYVLGLRVLHWNGKRRRKAEPQPAPSLTVEHSIAVPWHTPEWQLECADRPLGCPECGARVDVLISGGSGQQFTFSIEHCGYRQEGDHARSVVDYWNAHPRLPSGAAAGETKG